MTKKDWQDAGDQIWNLVQDAVDRGDYSQLSSTISNVVNRAMDGLEGALKDSLDQDYSRSRSGEQAREPHGRPDDRTAREGKRTGQNEHAQHQEEPRGRAQEQWTAQQLRRQAAERIRGNMKNRAARPVREEYRPVRKKLKAPGRISGQVMRWTGYGIGGMFGLTFLIFVAIRLSVGGEWILPITAVWGILAASGLCLGAAGKKKLGLAKRFQRYVEVLGERTFCRIEELAASTGESGKFVRKDLKKMIRRGFFPEAYLDQKETCLITDRQTYQQYEQTQQAYEERARRETESQKQAKQSAQEERTNQERKQAQSGLAEMMEEGRNYIRHIRECNDRIPDREMSEKLSRLEAVVERIFKEAEKHPETAGDLKKMMSYYLPTTRKLLDAYCDLNEQPIEGENIGNTKKEIEQALDTLNEAFERLLDSLFEERAWDISSDISVLNTMLAQEGLTGQPFGEGTKASDGQ